MGGGPPARRPRCELRSARRLEARPGPAAHGHRSLALPPPTGAAHGHRSLALPPPTRSPHASLMTRLLVAPRVFRAPEGPAAREARRPHFVRRRASKPARALRSLRRPSHQWGLVVLCGSARCFGACPGPATAHGRRSSPRVSQLAPALRSLRRPPHQWCPVAVVWFGALFWCLSGPRRRPWAPQLAPRFAARPCPPVSSTVAWPPRNRVFAC